MTQKLIFKCTSCKLKYSTFFRLVEHYELKHFSIPCLLSKLCLKEFKQRRHFLTHARNKHKNIYKHLCFPKITDTVADLSNQIEVTEEFADAPCIEVEKITDTGNSTSDREDSIADISADSCNSEANLEDILGEHLLGFAQKLRYNYKVTNKAIDFIMNEISFIAGTCSPNMTSTPSINEDRNITFKQSTGQISSIVDYCEILSSDYKRKIAIRTSKYYVSSETVDLRSPCDVSFKSVKKIEYVPILDSIKNMIISNPKLEASLSSIVNNNGAISTSLSDYCDGFYCKTNKLLSNSNTIRVQLYYDEFNIANPLRNRVSRLKMTAVYFRLLNMLPNERSKLKNIRLCLLFYSRLLKEITLDKVFAPLVEDLQKLELHGIEVKGNIYKGSVAMVCADNLGAQNLGGFMESSGNKFCRKCMASKNDKTKSNITNILRRTVESYDKHLDLLGDDPSLIPVYGIKHDCPFNSLEYFHAIMGFPFDIFHDLCEGVCHDVLQILFKVLVAEEVCTKNLLQNYLAEFPYSGSDSTDKPTDVTISPDWKIRVSAMQMFCLYRLLPLIIGQYIPVNHPTWECYLILRRIIDIVFSFEISMLQLADLELMLPQFAESLMKLNSNAMLKPKGHYLLHYAEEIKNFGPLVNCGTIRFEAKHLFFKEVMQNTKNRKNILKFLAKSHQEYMCFLDNSKVEGIRVSAKLKKDESFRYNVKKVAIQKSLLKQDENFEIFKNCSLGCIALRCGDCFPLLIENAHVKIFGFVHCIIKTDSVIAIIQKLKVLKFDHHLHSYKIESPSSNMNVISFSDLTAVKLNYSIQNIQILSPYYVNNVWYISLKRNPISNLNLL